MFRPIALALCETHRSRPLATPSLHPETPESQTMNLKPNLTCKRLFGRRSGMSFSQLLEMLKESMFVLLVLLQNLPLGYEVQGSCGSHGLRSGELRSRALGSRVSLRCMPPSSCTPLALSFLLCQKPRQHKLQTLNSKHAKPAQSGQN